MKSFKLYLFLVSAMLIGYLVLQYNAPRKIDWSPTLINKDKIPFGTYVLYSQLHDIFPKANIRTFREPAYNVLTDHGIKYGTYVIICQSIYELSKTDYTKLNQFVKAGNDVFIASEGYGEVFAKNLKIETKSDLEPEVSNLDVHFMNKNLDSSRYYRFDKNMSTEYFSKMDTGKVIALGENALHHCNFLKYPIGKGNLYLHTNPTLFSNYSVLQKQGASYAAIALSHLKNDKTLLWDEYYTQGRSESRSVMRVFLLNPGLRAAFYLSVISLLIFVLYEKKRRQRIIPIIAPLNNTTVEFVSVVGQVYYEQRNNSDIAHKKSSYFLEHVRTKYLLKTNVLDDNFVATLANKSGADAKLIHELTNRIIRVRVQSTFTDAELIDLNKNIEQFNIQSR